MDTDRRPDHGAFLIHIPQEENVIVFLYERVAKNPDLPGEAWARVETTWAPDADPQSLGEKVFHLDTNCQVLEITERWGGEETARRTVDLSDYVN